MTYLEDNPPNIRQYRHPRRETPSGVIVVHTAESQPDETSPDDGAENVAAFIRDRTTHGSYHDLADSDSIVHLVPYDAEAYHDGTGSNPHSYGVSAATQAHMWRNLDDTWVDATVRNMAKTAARYAQWVHTHHGITIPARRINKQQSDSRTPGFISHAQRDPARRTDPGEHFPWATFLGYYKEEMGDDEMTPEDREWISNQFAEMRDLINRRTGDVVEHPYSGTDNPEYHLSNAVADIWKIVHGIDIDGVKDLIERRTGDVVQTPYGGENSHYYMANAIAHVWQIVHDMSSTTPATATTTAKAKRGKTNSSE